MTAVEVMVLTPLILVGSMAVVLMLLAAFYRKHRVIYAVYQLGLLLALVSVAATAPARAMQVTPLLRIDGFFAFFAALFIVAAMAVGAMTAQYFRRRRECRDGAEEAYVLLAVATLGALVLAGADHFAALFLGVELIGVASFVLAAFPSGAAKTMNDLQQRSLEAGFKYLLLSAVASGFLLFGIALLYLHSGSLAFSARAATDALPGVPLAALGVGMFLIGAAFKLSVVPFHLWAADVYQAAPTPVTALIATIAKGALIAGLLRLFSATAVLQSEALTLTIVVLASLSMLAGNFLALRQDNIKRLLAYSSIAHIGYLLVALLAVIVPAEGGLPLQACAVYVLAYSVTTLAAFSVVNTVSEGGGLSAYRLPQYRGLLWRAPWLAGCFIFILLSLAGIPLTIGFIGKFYIFAAGARAELWFLLAMVVLGSAIGLYYYLRVILTIVQTPGASLAEADNWRERWLSYGLTVFLVVLGVYPAPLLDWLPAL